MKARHVARACARCGNVGKQRRLCELLELNRDEPIIVLCDRVSELAEIRVLRKEHIFTLNAHRRRRVVIHRTHENFREVTGK
jgi:hypothetical protein